MGMIADRLNLRLLIDGVEVPVVGATCTFAEGSAATAEIQVIATDEVHDITPRSFVTLFVYDKTDFVEDPVTGKRDLRIGPTDVRRWKLLFAGELIGVSVSKAAGSRQAALSCMCHTNYWDFIRQHYINQQNAGIELFEAAFMGVKQDRLKFFDVPTLGVATRLFTWLTQSKNANGEANMYLGVQRVLREMFFSSSNFYAEAFNRLRLGDQLVGLPDDETAAKLFKLEFFEKFIKNQTDGAGGMVTARQLIDTLLGPVFHTYVTVPCPRFDRKGKALGLVLDPKKAADKPLLEVIIPQTNSWPGASLNYTVIKPDTWFLVPPICNVVFPHQYRSMSYSRNYLAEPTRLFLRTSLLFSGADKWLTERFYAPDFEVFNQELYKEGGYFERLAGTLLPHEEFSGINPAQVWQADLPAYVQKGARRDYLARLADYTYWKYRFGSRQVNVSGPLNLNLVPGYPGAVIDRVDSNTGILKHYVGNIATLSHVIDQNGGWTHFTMTGARTHDETADFDQKGRGLEEVTTRGSDGFLDDRYNPSTIGSEVYQTIFGCDSLADATSLSLGTDDFLVADLVKDSAEAAAAKESPTRSSIDLLTNLYRLLGKNGGDVDRFVDALTHRPKATFAELMGTDLFLTSSAGQAGFSSEEYSELITSDPALDDNREGFFAAATSPDSSTVQNAEYTDTKGKKAKYELEAHLRARQAKVQKYVESLRLRGMRG